MQNLSLTSQAAEYLKKALPSLDNPVGVILGTGLGGWADGLDKAAVSYADVPGFPRSTVDSHAGELRLGRVGDSDVLALCGRFHLYEGYSAGEAVTAVRALALLGVKTLILTNAAGALNPSFDTGSLMAITDHINFTGKTPLSGANVDQWGERFPDMSRVWDGELVELAIEKSLDLGIRLERGVYIQVHGPQMETPAETRAFRILGADAVGMSTAIEAVAARHMGLRLLGVSCLTNKNLPDCMAPASLEDVIAQANTSGRALGRLLTAVIEAM